METSPISVYLSLVHGQKAEIETAANFAIALSQAVKQVVYIIEPGVTVRYEIVSGDESSLWLNTRLNIFGGNWRSKVRSHIGGLTAASIFLGQTVVIPYIGNEAINWARGTGQPVTKEEVEQIITAAVKAGQNADTQAQSKQGFKALERDEAVTGVGLARDPRAAPFFVVPRTDFRSLAGITVTEETPDKRTREDWYEVRLLAPFLDNSDRTWRFVGLEGEFGAHMKDPNFLADAVSGRLPLRLMGGITMDVRLQTKETREEGIWRPRERNVLEVRNPRSPVVQLPLPMPPKQ